MASNSQKTETVFSKDIFHGLPTFPDAVGKKYSAVVAGANGITGSYIIRALAEAPERWGMIYALSRRPSKDYIADNVKHLSVDFLSSPEDISQQLTEHVSKVYAISSCWLDFEIYSSPSFGDFSPLEPY
jgi:hypothetical protein